LACPSRKTFPHPRSGPECPLPTPYERGASAGPKRRRPNYASRNLARRLERPEAEITPAEEKILVATDKAEVTVKAICRRAMWPNGTVFENVVLGTSSDGHEPPEEELNQWVESFPIEQFSNRLCRVALPSDTHVPAEARSEAM